MLRTLTPVPPAGLAASDLAAVTAINERNVPAVGAASADHLARLIAMSTASLVMEVDDEVVGFAIILGPGCDYASENYAWFASRHDDFAYVDRIALDPLGQGRGLGRATYQDVIARTDAPVLCAEVNVRPRNDASLAFHDRLGFVAVGEQETHGGSTRVRFLERALT